MIPSTSMLGRFLNGEPMSINPDALLEEAGFDAVFDKTGRYYRGPDGERYDSASDAFKKVREMYEVI